MPDPLEGDTHTVISGTGLGDWLVETVLFGGKPADQVISNTPEDHGNAVRVTVPSAVKPGPVKVEVVMKTGERYEVPGEYAYEKPANPEGEPVVPEEEPVVPTRSRLCRRRSRLCQTRSRLCQTGAGCARPGAGCARPGAGCAGGGAGCARPGAGCAGGGDRAQ